MSDETLAAPNNLSALFARHHLADEHGAYLRVTTNKDGELFTQEEKKAVRVAKTIFSFGAYGAIQERKLARLVLSVAENDLLSQGADKTLKYRAGYSIHDQQAATIGSFVQAIQNSKRHINIKKSFEVAKHIAATGQRAEVGAALNRAVGESNSQGQPAGLEAWVDSATSPSERSAREQVKQQVAAGLERYISSGPASEHDAREAVANYLKAHFQTNALDLDALASGPAGYEHGGGIEISELPAVFQHFPNLVEINLTAKSGLLHIDNLYAPLLQSLNVRNSFIQSLPRELDQRFPQLQRLDVGSNLIVGIESNQRWPASLEHLDLRGNAFFVDYKANLPGAGDEDSAVTVSEPEWSDDKSLLRHRHDIFLRNHPVEGRVPQDFFIQRDRFLVDPFVDEQANVEDANESPSRNTVTVNGVELPAAYFQPKEGNLESLPLPVDSSLDQVVSFWFDIAGENVPPGLKQQFEKPVLGRPDLSSRELIQGLSMLSGSEEFNAAGKQALARRITQLLIKAANNPTVKEDLLDNCGLFSGTCHDGAAEALLHMENSAEVLQFIGPDGLIDGDKVPKQLKRAIKQSVLVEAARQHALEKMGQENLRRAERRAQMIDVYEPNVDFVEFNLSYLTAMRNRGVISIGPTDYRYRGEGRSWLDANTGIASILRKSSKTEVVQEATKRLAARPGWQSAIVKLQPQTQSALVKLDDEFEQRDPFAPIFLGEQETLSREAFNDVLPILRQGITGARQAPGETHQAFVKRVSSATRALAELQSAFAHPSLPEQVTPDQTSAAQLYAAYAWAKDVAREQIIADATVAWVKA